MHAQHQYDDLPVLPLPLPPEEVFAMLIGDPELLQPEAVLREKYANESDQERELRGKRYATTLEEFDRRYNAYLQRWQQLFKLYKRKVNTYIEQWEQIPPL